MSQPTKTIAAYNQEMRELRAKHFDETTKRWKNDNGSFCTPEETKAFQDQHRGLKFKIQMIEEAELVSTFYDKFAGAGNGEVVRKLMPLVSRREWPTMWAQLGKEKPDGSLFTFNPTDYNELEFCNCTDDQLNAQIAETGLTIEQLTGQKDGTLEDMRVQHTLILQGIHKTGAMCMHPKTVYEPNFQVKHTIGNWKCQGCLNQDVAGGEKAMEWCPRFIPMLRTRTISEYIQMVSSAHDNKVCYAGLLHIEINLEEENGKHYAVVTKKCDTCTYVDIEKKEYHMPEQVADDQLLMLTPETRPEWQHQDNEKAKEVLNNVAKEKKGSN